MTLLEVVAVIAIISVIMTLSVVGYRRYEKSIMNSLAEDEVSLLKCGIELYRSKFGSYPIANSRSVEENAKSLYGGLLRLGDDFLNGHKWKIFEEKILDPWGNPYVYTCGDSAYMLYSNGDGVESGVLTDGVFSR